MADKNYQMLQTELDAILSKLQNSQIEVDEAVKLYEQGTKLIAQLEKHLKQAENKLTKLKQTSL